jgi:hypothetical protein
MLKDIPKHTVENIALAVIKDDEAEQDNVWEIFLVNLKVDTIEGVLVTSKGYGNYQGKNVKTSVLRHFLDTIPGKSFSKIEPIIDNLFGLSNEYWVSFYHKGILYDKKFVFLPESIRKEFFTRIPIINKMGVMIR